MFYHSIRKHKKNVEKIGTVSKAARCLDKNVYER